MAETDPLYPGVTYEDSPGASIILSSPSTQAYESLCKESSKTPILNIKPFLDG
jgi:hypothetical protein